MLNMKYKFFKNFAISLFFVFVLNSLASFFYWYSSIKQFDMLMHFLGGFTAALFSFWFLYGKFVLWIEEGKKWRVFRVIVLMVLVIALLWEAMEFSVQGFFGVTVLADIPDSISDVLIGLLGSIVGAQYIFGKYKRERAKEPFKI